MIKGALIVVIMVMMMMIKKITNSKTMKLIKLGLYMTFAVLLTLPGLSLAAPADENLIANPGFEYGNILPLKWTFVTNNGNTPIWDTVSHKDLRSVKISIPGTSDSKSGYPQSKLITAIPLQFYSFSAWGKTENAGGTSKPAVRVVELDASKKYLRQTNLVFSKGTNDWKKQRMEFRTLSNTAHLYVYANIWGGTVLSGWMM